MKNAEATLRIGDATHHCAKGVSVGVRLVLGFLDTSVFSLPNMFTDARWKNPLTSAAPIQQHE